MSNFIGLCKNSFFTSLIASSKQRNIKSNTIVSSSSKIHICSRRQMTPAVPIKLILHKCPNTCHFGIIDDAKNITSFRQIEKIIPGRALKDLKKELNGFLMVMFQRGVWVILRGCEFGCFGLSVEYCKIKGPCSNRTETESKVYPHLIEKKLSKFSSFD